MLLLMIMSMFEKSNFVTKQKGVDEGLLWWRRHLKLNVCRI